MATCDVSLEGPRDRALLYFGFASGGRRRSEIAAAELADLRPLPERGFFIYRLEYNKTQQDSPSATSTPDKPILGRAAEPVAAWSTGSGRAKARSSAGFGRTRGLAPARHQQRWRPLVSAVRSWQI